MTCVGFHGEGFTRTTLLLFKQVVEVYVKICSVCAHPQLETKKNYINKQICRNYAPLFSRQNLN